jgi:hypothetical protein
MSVNFETLANSLKSQLEQRFGKERLKGDYIYKELERITLEWKTGKFTSNKTDIGVAAVKLFDSGLPEDDELANGLCTLAEMFRRRTYLS